MSCLPLPRALQLRLSVQAESESSRQASWAGSAQITTTVLWLNEFHGFDIRCVRLSPYLLDDRLLLDVQQVIPLPEASQYTIRVREKEIVARQASQPSTMDRTKFVVITPSETSVPLPKRRAILLLVEELVKAGVSIDAIRPILPESKLVRVDGTYGDADDLWAAMKDQLGKTEENKRRWHLESPLTFADHSWVLHSNWGTKTRGYFDALKVLKPGFDVREEGEVTTEPT